DRLADVDHAALVQIAPRKWQTAELERGALIVAALHPARRKVAQQLRPRFLGVADDDAVGVAGGFVGDQRRMHAAEYDRDASRAERARQLVRTRRGAR